MNIAMCMKGEEVDQWVVGRLEIQRPEVRTPPASGAQEKIVRFFSEWKMLCWLAVGVPNPRGVYTHV